MPTWKRRALDGVRRLVAEGRIVLTIKAAQELVSLDLGLRPSDLTEILMALQVTQAVERLRSHHNDAWLYVFKTEVEGTSVYLKVALSDECVVISCHDYIED